MILLLFAAGLFPAGLMAQTGPEVDSKLALEKVGVGELNTYSIMVFNGSPGKVPQALNVEGLVFQQTSTKQTFVDGRSRFDFIYTVIGKRPGTFTIPEVEIEVDGQPAKTQEHTLTIFARESPEEAMDGTRSYFAVMQSDVKEIYENQIIPFTLTAFSKSQIQEISGVDLSHDAFVVRKFQKLTFSAQEVDGVQFYTAIVPGTMFALKPGKQVVGPAEMTARIVDTSSSFGPRMLLARMRNQELASNSVEIDVKPLPSPAPASFTGGVGDFSMRAQASTTELKVGDPIQVEILITGSGNFETMEAPLFLSESDDEWKTYEARKISDSTEGEDGVALGRVTFSQIVIPQSELTEIPGFELSFFNPETGAYGTKKTDPIPITVAPDPRANRPAVAPLVSAGTGGDVPTAPKPSGQFNDILTISMAPPKWRELPVAATSRSVFWLAQAVPSMALFTLLGIGLARWLGQQKARAVVSEAGHELSFQQAVAAIPAVGSSRTEFYKAVKEAMLVWERDHTAKEQGELASGTMRAKNALDSRCEWLLYGAEEARRDRAVSEREFGETRDILKRLEAAHPSAATEKRKKSSEKKQVAESASKKAAGSASVKNDPFGLE